MSKEDEISELSANATPFIPKAVIAPTLENNDSRDIVNETSTISGLEEDKKDYQALWDEISALTTGSISDVKEVKNLDESALKGKIR